MIDPVTLYVFHVCVATLIALVRNIVVHNERMERQEREAQQNTGARRKLDEIKARYQYMKGCFHIAVVGNTSTGKSSLINAFRGIADGEVGSAQTGDGETTRNYQKYVDPRSSKLVWYDIPGSGTQNHPSWEYFSKESLFLFDAILVVIGPTIMTSDIELIKLANQQDPPIPTHVVRAKSDTHIRSTLEDAGFFDTSDLGAVKLAKGKVAIGARAAAEMEIRNGGLPAETRFYQLNKHSLLAIVKEDGRRLAAYQKFEIDEQKLIKDLFDDVKRAGEP